MKKLIAGNWKMNGDKAMAMAFDTDMADAPNHVDWLICAPFPYLSHITNTSRGAQDCSMFDSGAHTGEISAQMLSEQACYYCIVGHSERRAMHYETNDIVKAKAMKAIENDITAIICVGETLDEREADKAFDVVQKQIIESLPATSTAKNTVIAYEPVWAIGTGKAATMDDVVAMHDMIRDLLKTSLADGSEMRIIYGGSVKPSNAGELLNNTNVNGALIGGASLKSEDFLGIGRAVKE